MVDSYIIEEFFEGKPAVRARSRQEWRDWLIQHHGSESAVWLIIYHKKSKLPSVGISEAMEEALCFGWIDSKGKKRDHESFYLTFSPRKPQSKWSKINRDRAERMIAAGLMTENGQKMIDLAKQTGTWEALDEIDNLAIPADLLSLLSGNEEAFRNFNAFPVSSQKLILGWVLSAKRPSTRQQRIEETVRLAAKNKKANHPGSKDETRGLRFSIQAQIK